MYRTTWLSAVSQPSGQENRLERHDLIYQTPPQQGTDGYPIGNGSLSAMVWHQARSTEIHLNHSDAIVGGPGGEFRAWSWEGEEAVPCIVSPGHLRIESPLPGFDHNWLSEYRGRLSLGEAELSVHSRTPFEATDLRALVAADPAVLLIECRFNSDEPVPRTISLERWGSRTAAHYYEQVLDDPTVHLDRTSAGAAPGTGDRDPAGWVVQEHSGTRIVVRAEVSGTGVCVERLHGRAVRWTLAPAREQVCTIRLTVAIERNAADNTAAPAAVPEVASPDALMEQAAAALKQASADPNGLLARHRERWRDYWNRSIVHISDDYLENIYHLHFYSLASCGLGRFPALFTGGGWTWNRDIRNWNHLYHWNQQQLYWAVHAAGRPELAENYLDFRWRQLPTARADAARLFGVEGAWFSDIASLTGAQAVEPDTRRNLTVGAQTASLFFVHGLYRKSRNPADPFLVERTLPFTIATARLYRNLLSRGPDGKLRIRGGTSPYESYLNLAESLTDHAAIRFLCRLLDALESHLGSTIGSEPTIPEDADLRPLRDDLPPWPLTSSTGDANEENGIFSPGVTHEGHRLEYGEGVYPFSPFPATLLAPVQPFGCIGLDDSGTSDFAIASRTLRRFLDDDVYRHGDYGCSGHTPVIQAAARLGLAKDAWAVANLFVQRYQHFANGFMHYSARDDHHGMAASQYQVRMIEPGIQTTKYDQIHEKAQGQRRFLDASRFVHPYYETSSNIAAGIQEMLLQGTADGLRVFPALPAEVDACFRLLSADGIEVMAEQRDGQMAWVGLRSPCPEPRSVILILPWSDLGQARVSDQDLGLECLEPVTAGRITLRLETGRLYVVSEPDRSPTQDYEEDWHTSANSGPKNAGTVRLGLVRDF